MLAEEQGHLLTQASGATAPRPDGGSARAACSAKPAAECRACLAYIGFAVVPLTEGEELKPLASQDCVGVAAVIGRAVTSPGAAVSPQPSGAPLAHASAERPRKSSYSVTMVLLQRISIDPAVRFGKPCVRGTRLTVGDVLGVLAAGRVEAELLLDFPQLTHEDVLACLAFAAEREKRLITSAAAV